MVLDQIKNVLAALDAYFAGILESNFNDDLFLKEMLDTKCIEIKLDYK